MDGRPSRVGRHAVARVFSAVGSQKALVPIVAIVALALIRQRGWRSLGLLGVAWGGAILLYSLAKHAVGRPRPPAYLWLVHVAGKAFPSGHAVQSLSTFVALALLAATLVRPSHRLPWTAVAILLATGVGVSRIDLGVHWTKRCHRRLGRRRALGRRSALALRPSVAASRSRRAPHRLAARSPSSSSTGPPMIQIGPPDARGPSGDVGRANSAPAWALPMPSLWMRPGNPPTAPQASPLAWQRSSRGNWLGPLLVPRWEQWSTPGRWRRRAARIRAQQQRPGSRRSRRSSSSVSGAS